MIDHLIAALNKEVDLSAEEIADTLWLAMHMEQSGTGISSSQTSKLDSETTEEKSNQRSEHDLSNKSEPTTSADFSR